MLSYHKRLFFSTRQKDSGTSFWPVPESGKGGALLLAQYGAVCERDRMSVKVDRPIVGQGSDRAVAGQGPGAAFLYGDDCVVVDGGSSVGIFCDVDYAGEAAAAGERQLERGDAVYDDIALKRLVVCGKFDLCAVAAGSAQPWLALLPVTFKRYASESLLVRVTPVRLIVQCVLVT